MTDHLDRLANTSDNFRFLVGPARLLAIDGAAAEALVYSDPNSAIAKCRRFTETLAKLLLDRSGLTLDSDKQFARTEALAKAAVIPGQIKGRFDDVRKKGNSAVHGHFGDVATALAVVEQCFELGAWWHRLVTGQQVPHTFTRPDPAETTLARSLLAEVEDRINQLHKAFMAGIDNATRRPEPRITIGPAVAASNDWHGGSAVTCDATTYVVHDPVETVSAEDRSWTFMRADAHAMAHGAARVRLHGLVTRSADAMTRPLAEGLAAQAAFLAGPGGPGGAGSGNRNGLPRLIAQGRQRDLSVVVTGRPDGSTWTQAFGAGPEPLDPMVVPVALDAIVSIAGTLSGLHRRGLGHRLLDGESILLTAGGRRGALRDLGLAGLPVFPGEGGRYRAPEQRTLASGRPGPPTDVFQLAALLLGTCTGVIPRAGQAVPLRMFLPAIPERLDRILVSALDPDPARRPDLSTFAAEVRLGRSELRWEATA